MMKQIKCSMQFNKVHCGDVYFVCVTFQTFVVTVLEMKRWCSDEDALNVCPPHSVWRSVDSFLANLHDNELRGKFSSEPKDLRIMPVWWGLKENTGIPKEACWDTAVRLKNPATDKLLR